MFSHGTIIEGTSHRVFADILNDRFAIGSVYILARCTLDMPRKAFRTCSFSLMLVVSPSNIGGIVRSPSLDFPTTAFELTQFEDLAGRQSPCPYLSSLPFQFAVAFFLFLLLILSIRCVLDGNSTAATRVVVDPSIPSTTVLVESYRIRLTMLDESGFATFVLLGKSADHVFPISAAQLSRVYPSEDHEYPDAINAIRGKTCTFEVRLSRNSRPGNNSEFRVSRVWDMDRTSVTPPLPPLPNATQSSTSAQLPPI
ncbi:hypothetical protein LINPERHAP1_LOCUS29253, partial [Linum perenne]